MSTRSNIAIYNTETETARVIYCHFDGYYDGVGKTLKEHYQDVEKVKKLIEGGDISSLGEHVEIPNGEKHDYNNRNTEFDITTFYGRDRGETGINAKTRYLSKDKLHRLKANEYLYVFLEKEGFWLCTHTKELVEL